MKSIYILTLSALLIACNANHEILDQSVDSDSSAKSVINPIKGLENIKHFQVDAIRKDTIFLENGGTILFEDNCFVDKDGKPVKGKVDIAWEEFHTLGDIIASGIPMQYDSAGVEFSLVSGGMFTINASQNDTPLEIAPGKKVAVNLVSLQDTPCYNFYALDEKSGNWEYETTKSGEPAVPVVESKEVETASILDVELDTRKFIELQSKDIIGWKTATALSSRDKSWLTANNANARLLKSDAEGWYKIEVKTSNGSRSFQVEPYFLEQALKDSNKNSLKMEKEIDEVIAHQRKKAAGNIVRSIEIDGFGTYNWDIICKRENSLPLIANFDFPAGVNPELLTLYLISPDENALVLYDATGDSKFSFDPNYSNCLVAILPDNSIVSVPNSGFDKARRLKSGASCTFSFNKTGIKLKSSTDIMNHIQSLI